MNDHIYMPNEIFEDFRENMDSSKHNAFAYTYYYYISYLYRYCKWNVDYKVTQAMIKEKLQLSPIEKRVDYIIKKGGILDSIGYTKTTDDYPIEWTNENGFIEFRTIKEHCKEFNVPVIITDKLFKVKLPTKGIFRTPDSENRKKLDGTFYEVDNTHKVEYSIFEKCMSEEDLGCIAFYIYGFLKNKNDIHGEGYGMALADSDINIGVSHITFGKYVKALEKHKLIKVSRYKRPMVSKKVNVYKTLEYL